MWGDFFLLREGKILLAQKIKRIREMLAGGRYKGNIMQDSSSFCPSQVDRQNNKEREIFIPAFKVQEIY